MSELYHHGIKGMKWGVRRYQNEDGSLTAAGKARYGSGDESGQKLSRKEKKLNKYKEQQAINLVNRHNRFVNAINSEIGAGRLSGEAANAVYVRGLERMTKELEVIQTLSYKQMKQEKVAAGRKRMATIIKSMGTYQPPKEDILRNMRLKGS